MKVSVYYLSLKEQTPNNDYWDYGFLNDFIDGNMWQPINFPAFTKVNVNVIPDSYSFKGNKREDVAIVVIAARHHADMVEEINKQLKKIEKVVLFLMGDEEADFPVEEIEHDNIHIWVQNPHPGRHDSYNKLGTGYPPQSQEILSKLDLKKDLDLYFSGQITHQRRIEMWDVLIGYQDSGAKCVIERTGGFTQGVTPENYYRLMVKARIAPSPAGAVIPDSFRLFEALESMAIPIADNKNSSGTIDNYWDWIFEQDVPFPKLGAWDRMFGLIDELDYPHAIHKITAWWINYKREFAYKVCNQLMEG